MEKKDIEKLQEKLNHLISINHEYSEIYGLSVELDKLIIKYYKNKSKKN